MLIQAEMDGKPKHEHVAIVCPTPNYLITYAGFPSLDIAIVGKTIGKALFDHGIVKSMLKRLPEILENPKCIFRSANPHLESSVVVMTFEVKGSSPIVIPIHQNRKIGRNGYYNLVASVYPKEGPSPEEKWKADGLLLWER